ncbi:multicopper oxidase family protein [Mycobacterium sp. CVI_P3]|uniref:Multicopper oxidase family protein n=1 Tax=Mycobacterium pinniadriaticum TaxID=2994102 RepID=A0ABT3SJ76_9MYCO|nr:multicopper oxidase family protein [Mycobacterium pinniadriaticum]MCX2933130.1 multicopper oxidase family protein [Mycobacterium pinniadriaticum]MCX2939570.1 multicopper oxidase family protein [Mycobacterium pinniadriaticum]
MSESGSPHWLWNRRAFLASTMAAGAGAALAACGQGDTPAPPLQAQPTTVPGSLTAAIDAAEAARPHSGKTVTVALTPRPVTVDLGGRVANTMGYHDAVPGPLIRANVGDEIVAAVTNKLDMPQSVHWHGITLRNNMDGVEPATPNIPPGGEFTYKFSVPDPGTYWAHPHTGVNADTGLYLPLIIDDPNERADYDAEWIVVLDDWTDGVGKSPWQIFADLRKGEAADVDAGLSDSKLLGGDPGDVSYPYYLINGRIPEAPTAFTAKPGQRIRLRIINAGADTAFRIALAGHRMTVTHTDGYPVVPVEVDALLLGMAERYDAIVTVGDGVFPLVALAEGKNALARALLTTGAGSAPDAGFKPPELDGLIGTVDMFTAAPEARLAFTQADVDLTAELSGNMKTYQWGVNGSYPNSKPFAINQGQQVMMTFANKTAMWHPMHLHGHTFAVLNANGEMGARKDTVIVLPNQSVRIAILADNPGYWALHCHNTYHLEAGMMTTFDYLN